MTMFERLERLEVRVGALEAVNAALDSVGSRLAELNEPMRVVDAPNVVTIPTETKCEQWKCPWCDQVNAGWASECGRCEAKVEPAPVGTPRYVRDPADQLRECFQRWRNDLHYNINDCEADALSILARARVATTEP